MNLETDTTVAVTVRFFAAASAAAGKDSTQLTVRSCTTIDELVAGLGVGAPELARVLSRCSLLCDGVAVRERTQPLRPGTTIDVLPPFAGG